MPETDESKLMRSGGGAKAATDVASAKAIASVINQAVGTSGNVVIEILRTSAANPIVGAVAMVLMVDILDKQGVLSKDPITVTIGSTTYTDTIHNVLIIWILGLTSLTEASTIFTGGVKTLSYGAADLAALLPLISTLV